MWRAKHTMNEEAAINEFSLPAPHKRNWRDWQNAQPPFQSTDPRFELRLSSPEDFPEIYALLNTVFDGQRTEAEFDWIYRKNPYGEAFCEVVIEKSSGQIITTNGHFPWPLRKGDQDFSAVQSGDAATHPRMQRQGLMSLRLQLQQEHPWNSTHIHIALPNEASRALALKYNQPNPTCPMPFAKKILDWRSFLSTKGVPNYLAKVAAPVAHAATRPPDRQLGELRIEAIHSFDQQHQALSLECSRSEGFWCPHGAQWMNWRYFGHPTKEYMAHGLYDGDQLKAFSVVRLDDSSAMLMELISSDIHSSLILLGQVEAIARKAGAITIDSYASESWKQWPALKQQRYFMRPSNIYVDTESIDYPDVLLSKNWQLLPGDSDVF